MDVKQTLHCQHHSTLSSGKVGFSNWSVNREVNSHGYHHTARIQGSSLLLFYKAASLLARLPSNSCLSSYIILQPPLIPNNK